MSKIGYYKQINIKYFHVCFLQGKQNSFYHLNQLLSLKRQLEKEKNRICLLRKIVSLIGMANFNTCIVLDYFVSINIYKESNRKNFKFVKVFD